MTDRQTVNGETGVYLGILYPEPMGGWNAENRSAKTRWFNDRHDAKAWITTQIIRDEQKHGG